MYYLNDLISLLFGRNCVHCKTSLIQAEKHTCIPCTQELGMIEHGTLGQQLVEQMFYGKANINAVMSFFQFVQGGVSQSLIHHLKYHNVPKIGLTLGNDLGKKLSNITAFNDIDAIVAVPMTTKKRRMRGYNQSDYVAKGVAQQLRQPVLHKILERTSQKSSQTQLNKFTRWQNINESFQLKKPLPKNIKHILLIDDVITTGATLESCANTIHEQYSVKISIASLAFAPLQG